MTVSENYTYELPESKIALRPVHPYDSAKLLHLDRLNATLSESHFQNLDTLLGENDVLVINNTKVNKCRLSGKIEPTGKEAELLILKDMENSNFECLARPVKNLKPGTVVVINDRLKASVLEKISDQTLKVRFEALDVKWEIEAAAVMPIPPYIRDGKGDAEDVKDYQTIFAENEGSVAAPTASLHFTEELLQKIREKGTVMRTLTLHIGMSSIRPIREGAENPGEEFYIFSNDLYEELKADKASGKRIVAVGTSVVRALESMFICPPEKEGLCGTDLFIRPGYSFKVVDALVTNFHFPGSTHLLLVEALIGRALLEKSYQHALDNGFRFLSYGDGMFIS